MATPTRILLIDDDAVDRMTVRRALSSTELNYELVEASDGAAGLRLARGAEFDCVLLDYRLPDVDAFDLLRDLQSPDGGRQAVLMLTGVADPEVAVQLMRAGALDHLAKAELSPSGLARAIRYAKARRGFLGELESARRDAEEKSAALAMLDRQKSLLFSIIAHDLRNPFQVLLGLSDVLSRAVAARDHAAIERRARGIHQAASDAHALMDGLFNWASIQMDSVDVVTERLAVADVVAGAIGSCREAAVAKGVAIVVEDRDLAVLANRDMVATIVRNLVGNAIKFTPAGGRIVIAAAMTTGTGAGAGDGADAAAGRVSIAIADSGVGMSPDLLAGLFRLDRRTTTPGTAGERGSGLGLLLCRDLAERLETTLEVESVPGEGTTFRFSLPVG